jgi:excisionase family DNA binding protein
MPYTLGDAAKATGISKPTLSKAIKSGRISAIKTENGSYSIDPAELHRVFPAVNGNRESNGLPLQIETPLNTLSQPLEMLEKERQERERERKQLQATIDDLRHRLDEEATDRRQSAEEIRRLTLLLTYRPEPPTAPAREIEEAPAILPAVLPSQQEAPEAPAPVRSRWEAASLTFAAVFAALVVSLALAHWIGWI